MSDCPICEKHYEQHNSLICETQNWIVNHGPLDSQILGYLYIEPKRHVEHWSDFTEEELSAIGPLFKKLEGVLKKELNIERVYTVTISEAVRHLHFHIVPRTVDEEVKGLSLIEQATQQNVKVPKNITHESYSAFIESLRKYF